MRFHEIIEAEEEGNNWYNEKMKKFSDPEIWSPDEILKAGKSALNKNILDHLVTTQNYKKEVYIVITEGSRIISVASIEVDAHSKNIWIVNLRIDPAYKNSGITKKLAYGVFDFAQEHNYNIKNINTYTELGNAYLTKIINSTAKDYPDVGLENKID